MKKVLLAFLLLSIMLISNTAMGCNKTQNIKVKIMVPDGITLIALGGLYDNQDIEIDNVSGPTLLSSAFTTKSHDIVIAPLNLGAKLYNNNNSIYKLDSMITFGNVYIISRNGTPLDNTLSNLTGKKIIAFGKNTTPDIIFRAALASKNIAINEDNIDYQSGISEVVPLFKGDNSTYDYALVAEPVVSQLQIKFGMELNVVDLQTVLADEMSSIPQAGVFVNPESKNIDKINKVLEKLKANIQNLKSNPTQYADNIVNKNEYFTNMTSAVIASAIQSGNVIDYLDAKDNKSVAEQYFELLIEKNSNLLDIIPSETFYY
jgi:NitT/TauT family transport system substrate-binding protein